jgi:4-diphosphocytidyl-2-C-methyl-D-erythritol kinase
VGLSVRELAEIGAELGSDVPFFLYGGTALAEGRGEVVTPLPDFDDLWLVLLSPPIDLPSKTATLFGRLRPDDFSDGTQTGQLVEGLRGGVDLADEMLTNVFERPALEVFPGLDGYWQAFADATGRPVHLAGAGPTLFVLARDEAEAKALADSVRQRIDAEVYAAATIGAEAATAVTFVNW